MGKLADDPQPPRRKTRPGSVCHIAAIVDQLDDEDTAVVLSWVNNSAEFPAAGVAAKLTEHDHPIGKSSVERHRRRDCYCRIDRPDLYE